MRKNPIWATLIFVISVFAFNASAGTKVQVCHIPPDDPTNFHTITINLNALAAHLAHGDAGGPCNANCATLCDDGDACTVDDIGDCEEFGCPATPELVDCDDGNPCTTDSCESTVGCINEPVVCIAPNACTISACATDTGECVDSPIVCDDGETCNLDTGDCETYVVGCPVWTQEELDRIGTLGGDVLEDFESPDPSGFERFYDEEVKSDVFNHRATLMSANGFFQGSYNSFYTGFPDVSRGMELTEAEYNICKQALIDHVTCVAGEFGCRN